MGGWSWWGSKPSTRAGWRESIDGLIETAHRLRALGTIASTLCEVAAARLDGMVTLIPSRGIDAAAGQLIVREAGGLIAFPDCDDPLGAPMDSTPRSHLVAARDRGAAGAGADHGVIDWIVAEKIAR